jgi:hypothetical protein
MSTGVAGCICHDLTLTRTICIGALIAAIIFLRSRWDTQIFLKRHIERAPFAPCTRKPATLTPPTCFRKNRRKPKWIETELLKFAAILRCHGHGCRTIAATFNARFAIERRETHAQAIADQRQRPARSRARDHSVSLQPPLPASGYGCRNDLASRYRSRG